MFWFLSSRVRGTIHTHFWNLAKNSSQQFYQEPSRHFGMASVLGMGANEFVQLMGLDREKQGSPQAFQWSKQTKEWHSKWTEGQQFEFHQVTTKPGQGLKTAKTHQNSKDNPLAILCFWAILHSQHTRRNWQWLPRRNWHRIHIFQLRFSSQRLEDLFSKSNGPKWANWLGSTINCWLTYCVHDLTMLGSCKCKSIVNEIQ